MKRKASAPSFPIAPTTACPTWPARRSRGRAGALRGGSGRRQGGPV